MTITQRLYRILGWHTREEKEAAILAALASGPSHGYAIIKAVEARGIRLTIADCHFLLIELERRGAVVRDGRYPAAFRDRDGAVTCEPRTHFRLAGIDWHAAQ